jgi:hypothetical protein
MVADLEVHGATDDLNRTVARVNRDESDAIGAIDGANLIHASHHNLLQSLAHDLGAFNDEAEVIEDWS